MGLGATGPWNDWYHVTIHVYGSWLRGDPRGWRSRHHREHVEGDYKHPPPKGKYDETFQESKRLMRRDPVTLRKDIRQLIVDWFAEKLRGDGIEILVVSVDNKHVHILARFLDHRPRYWIGWAKSFVSQQAKAHGLTVGLNLQRGEGLWAKRCHPEPIKNREHQLHTFKYIFDHTKHGAKVWRFDRA